MPSSCCAKSTSSRASAADPAAKERRPPSPPQSIAATADTTHGAASYRARCPSPPYPADWPCPTWPSATIPTQRMPTIRRPKERRPANGRTRVLGPDHIRGRPTTTVDRETAKSRVIDRPLRPAGTPTAVRRVAQRAAPTPPRRSRREIIRDRHRRHRTIASQVERGKSSTVIAIRESICLTLLFVHRVIQRSSRKSPGRNASGGGGGDYYSNGSGGVDRDRVSSKDRSDRPRESRGKDRTSGSGGGGGRGERDDRSKHDRYATSRSSSHRTAKHRERSRERSADRSRDRKR